MPLWKYEERTRFCAPLPSIVHKKFLTFPMTIALQYCKLIRLAVRYLRLSLDCYSNFLSFSFAVEDLKLPSEDFIVRPRLDEIENESLLDLLVDEQPVALASVDMTLALSETITFQRVILVFGRKRCTRLKNRHNGIKQRQVKSAFRRAFASPLVGGRLEERVFHASIVSLFMASTSAWFCAPAERSNVPFAMAAFNASIVG